MPSPLHFLVIEGNTAATSAAMAEFGSRPYAEQYAAALSAEVPDATFTTVRPADGDPDLPTGVGLGDFDGVVLTGSALNIPAGGAPIDRQIALAQAVYGAGVPFFGSCWALQVATAAAGGSVRTNPKGRETGIARKITPTAQGAGHALLSGRPAAWDAPAIHLDEVDAMPPDAVVLATNGWSRVQAAEIRHGAGVFVGVQYHPEFDLAEIGRIFDKLADDLATEGLFGGPEGVKAMASDLKTLHTTPGRRDLAFRLGLDEDVLDPVTRRREIANWIAHWVIPRRRSRESSGPLGPLAAGGRS